MKTFREFVDKKARLAKRQLRIVERILKQHSMAVGSFLEDDDPYIFLKNPNGQTSFEGVRIYKIGDSLAYRIQKEDKTHPYGKAYQLDIEGMYDDMISDKFKEEKAGQEIIKAIKEEFASFFAKSADAEKRLQQGEFDKRGDPLGDVMVKSGMGTDYANLVYSKT